ncbi:MAG: hypothetical protein KVP17_002390 [Porospora cf. gigantea B]|uniref:uncharacterized protein n=1 Tax=Porospora cf. gigantea B TaxID=2853592 RepID=UPI0035719FC9|nr:MAG: hypothetical protein KVP17_002390 [Porospora cf. gigantea B]
MMDHEAEKLERGVGCRAAVDTGSSLMTAPSILVSALSERLDVKEDCSNKHKLPVFQFVMRDIAGRSVVFDMSPDDYVVEIDTLKDKETIDTLKKKKGGNEKEKKGGNERKDGGPKRERHCMLGLIPMDVPPPRGPLLVIGNNFLQKYATIYDADNLLVGFMEAQHNAEPSV